MVRAVSLETVIQYCGLMHQVGLLRGPPAVSPALHAPSHTTASVELPATSTVTS